MKTLKLISALVLMLAVSLSSYAQHVHDTSKEKIDTDGHQAIFLAADELSWITAFDGFPIEFSLVSGNAFETPHGTFGKFPGTKDFGKDFLTPQHIHGNSYQAVVIQGTMINPVGNEDPKKAKRMGPGSYWYQPGNQVHTTGCVSKEPCIFYMHQPVAFNFVPKTLEEQKAEAKK